MNQLKYNLIVKILDSDLTQKTKDEIVRFYTLPRNTAVPSAIEYMDDDDDDNAPGPIRRPTAKDERRRLNPIMAEEEDAMSETISAIKSR